jgi:hypothetical protein
MYEMYNFIELEQAQAHHRARLKEAQERRLIQQLYAQNGNQPLDKTGRRLLQSFFQKLTKAVTHNSSRPISFAIQSPREEKKF